MSLYFECSVRFDKMQQNGSVKKVTEKYIVDALSFTEAEARITAAMQPYISGEFSIPAIKKTKIAEIFLTPETEDSRWFLVKVAFISLDEKTAAEKRTISQILVESSDISAARERFNEGMKGTMADYDVESIADTKYMDVFTSANFVVKHDD